jgi:hypothetical protein
MYRKKKRHEINVPWWSFHGQRKDKKSPKTFRFTVKEKMVKPVAFVFSSRDRWIRMRIDGCRITENKSTTTPSACEFRKQFLRNLLFVFAQTDPESG